MDNELKVRFFYLLKNVIHTSMISNSPSTYLKNIYLLFL